MRIDSDVERNGCRWLKQLQANPARDISAIDKCNKIWPTSAASMRVYQPQTQDSGRSGRMKGFQLLFLPPCETK